MLSIRAVVSSAVTCVLSLTLAAQVPQPATILANDNRTPAGALENGVLNLALEIRAGAWHPEAENGPQLYVEAFGETGKPTRIPGPLLRVLANTTVHVTLTNTLKTPATVYGFVTHPASSDPGVQIPPNQTREITFASGAPGTYLYWARTSSPTTASNGRKLMPFRADAQLNGAFIVDSPGPVPPDRILVLNLMRVPPDILHPEFDIATMNGKEYPYTEPLQYTMGDIVRWRVLNPSVIDHPMHLHGSFYNVVSLGNADAETDYTPDEQQSVVTHDVESGGTMMAEWTPSHPGRWLFHCHYHIHMSDAMRVPLYGRSVATAYRPLEPVAGTPEPADPKGAMSGMGGMMMMIHVRPKPGSAPEKPARNPRKIELVLQPDSNDAKSKLLSCSIREAGKVVTSHDRSTGPALILKRDQPVEITVVNHLTEPTTIHWHGLELDSYYDGVMGGGMGDQVTPEIAPGGSFVVRFTPTRAGTFIYHTHSPDPAQLANGIYGAIIVLDPGQRYDPSHDELLVIGARDLGLLATHITVNGSETMPDLSLQHGVTYRIRIVNIAPNLEADVALGSKDHPLTWRNIAKDGADVPSRLAKPGNAFVHIVSGETYDFELRPDQVGDFPIAVENWFNKAKLSGEFEVR